MNPGVEASRQSAAIRGNNSQRRSAETPLRGDGSWEAPIRFCARIGTMNQIGAPLPALSPQGGERVAEGPERGGSWGEESTSVMLWWQDAPPAEDAHFPV